MRNDIIQNNKLVILWKRWAVVSIIFIFIWLDYGKQKQRTKLLHVSEPQIGWRSPKCHDTAMYIKLSSAITHMFHIYRIFISQQYSFS